MLAEKANYPVVKMCAWLGISRAAWYAWSRSTIASPRLRRRRTLAGLVKAACDASLGTYGARRVAADLRRGGQQVSVRLVAELMAEQGLIAWQPRPFRTTTVHDGAPTRRLRTWCGGTSPPRGPA